MKIIQVAEGAYFVPCYSEQTIMRAYTIDVTVQSFDLDNGIGEFDTKKESEHQEQEMKVVPPAQLDRSKGNSFLPVCLRGPNTQKEASL